MKKGILKLVSTILVLVLLANMLPMSIFAEEFRQSITQTESNAVKETAPEDAYVVSEITEKRTEYSKEFLLSNGLHMATVYADAVHYETEDGWEEIDNTLKTNADGTYSNTAGVWDVTFPEQMGENESIIIEKDGYTLSFSMSGELTAGGAQLMTEPLHMGTAVQTFGVTDAQTAIGEIQQIDTSAMKQAAEHPETVPVKLQSQIAYAQVYENTDIVYDLDSNKVKESMILESYNAELQGYSYTLEVGTMVPVLGEDGSITLYDETQENIVMVMPAPYLIDGAGEHNYDVEVQLIGKGSTYTLIYLLPQQWLAATDRAWPVVLDPIVEANLAASNIRDRTVAQKKTYSQTAGTNLCGWDSDTGIMRSYLKYSQLPNITSSDVVLYAEIQMYKAYESSTTTTVEVHKVLGNGNWDSSDITWSTAPTFDETIEDFAIVDDISWYRWIVTDMVRDWYAGANTGILFKASNAIETGGTANFKSFLSADFGTEVSRPVLTIFFRNNNGLESYWDYTSSSAGRAGTGYVNNYTGNLVWVRDTIGFGGNRMPVTISQVYNLNDAVVVSDDTNSNDTAGNKFGMGYGWRSNFNQLVYQWNVNSNYYVWEDSDGTDHYFKHESGSTYKDEDGLELTLTTNGSGTEKYCIEDKNGNKSFFDTQGRLTKQINNQATKSSITVTYISNTSRQISTVTDGVGRRYDFTYSGGLLTRISYKGSGSTELSYVTFGYSGSKLTTVTDKDNKVSTYTYDGSLLKTAADIDGYKLTYTYSTPSQTWQPYRVKSVAESDGNALGGSLTFSYAHNQTTVTDYNGNVEIYQFNDFGNTISIQDDEGHAAFAQYSRTDKDDTAGKGNQLTLSSKLQNTVGNRLKNNSFEDTAIWTSNSTSLTLSQSTEAAYIGSKSMKMVSTAEGTVAALTSGFSVNPGETYTFSAYVKTESAYAVIALQNSANYSTYTGDHLAPNNNWTRLQVSYTNTTDAAVTIVPILFLTAAGTAYMDNVQAEKASSPSRYNLLDNGDFRHGSYGWNAYGMTSADTTIGIYSDLPPAGQLDNSVYRITGNPKSYKQLVAYVGASGSAGDSYVFSGWAKGNSVPVPDNSTRSFGLIVAFNNTDGTSTKSYANFNTDSNEWQYTANAAVADKAYFSITVMVVYNLNANTVYFDGIQLYKEEFGSSYTYDDEKNIISVKDLQGQITQYDFDDETNSKLLQIIQNGSAKMTYTYDSYHNVETATTEEGLVYNFVYDDYGNNTEVSITSNGKTMRSEACYIDPNDDSSLPDGNYLVYTKDALGKVTTYGYNPQTGVLEWVQYPEDTADTRTEYTYDNMYRMASAACETNTGLNLKAEYTYTDDLLTKIETPSTTYNFTYGDFDLRTGVSIGNRTLATYKYTEETVDDRKYDLDILDYGNNDSVEYEYDDKGRITKQTYEDGDYVTNTYDNDGQLYKVYDSQSGITTTYYYDLSGRLVRYTQVGTGCNQAIGWLYDNNNNITYVDEKINGEWRGTYYTYDGDNRVTRTYTSRGARTYAYDAFGRLSRKEGEYNGGDILVENYTYTDPSATSVSAQVAIHSITAGGTTKNYAYAYDNNGNITSISDGTNTTTYVYDSANQLIRENNQAGNYTYTWTYDNAGNILNRKEYAYTTGTLGTPTDTVTYSYGDEEWRDLLTAYDGNTITYDQIGNPLTDGTWTYTWQHGRQLASMTDGTTTWTYTYNADGMRTSKTNGATAYSYYYDGSKLLQMTVGSDKLKFAYDAEGIPLTLLLNSDYYFYVTNLQGDVIALTDHTGAAVVTYTYDAWGNILTTTGSMASTLGTLNPLRYRGYVYDTETGLYYLQSRYYDPQMGRFLNADSYAATGQGFVGNNMFAYCLNNPVMYKDETGSVAVMTAAATAGVAISAQALLPVVIVVLAVVIFTDPNVQSAIADGFECVTTTVKSWVDEKEETITERMTVSLAKATQPEEEKWHLHHIVAQKASKAGVAQLIMWTVFPDVGVNHVLNLIYVKQSVHQRLHTYVYYEMVNQRIYYAYISAGLDKNKQLYNVTRELLALRLFIESLNALSVD